MERINKHAYPVLVSQIMNEQRSNAIVLLFSLPFHKGIAGILQEYLEPPLQIASLECVVVSKKRGSVFRAHFVEPGLLFDLLKPFFLVICYEMGKLMGKRRLCQGGVYEIRGKIEHFLFIGIWKLKLQMFVNFPKISSRALFHTVN